MITALKFCVRSKAFYHNDDLADLCLSKSTAWTWHDCGAHCHLPRRNWRKAGHVISRKSYGPDTEIAIAAENNPVSLPHNAIAHPQSKPAEYHLYSLTGTRQHRHDC